MERTLNDTNRVLAAQLVVEGGEAPEVPRLDLEQLAQLIEQSPGALLFPLHEALKSPESQAKSYSVATMGLCGASPCSGDPACQGLNAMNELLCKIDSAVTQLDAVTQLTAKAASGYGRARNVLCTGLFATDGVADVVSKVATVSSLVLGLAEAIANKLEGWGLAVFDGGIEFGVSAAVAADVAYEQRLRRKGKLMKVFILPLKALSDLVSTRVSDCHSRLNEQLVICTLKYKAQQNSTYEECRLKVLYSSEEFGFY